MSGLLLSDRESIQDQHSPPSLERRPRRCSVCPGKPFQDGRVLLVVKETSVVRGRSVTRRHAREFPKVKVG
jgi:hypothetical protein